MVTRSLLAGIFILMFAWPASAQFDRFLKDLGKDLGLNKPAALSDDKVVAGLKEALQVGSENTVKLTGG